MTVLKIYNLDDEAEEEAICTLTEGEHHIGRGHILRCKDKRVPRDHLVINVNKEGASIKSVHANPYFYRPQGGNIQMLKLNMTSALNNDDQFALLAYDFWFKVKVLKELPDESNNNDNVGEENDPGSPAKRKIEDESTPKPKSQKNDLLDSTVENLESSNEQLEGSHFTNATLPIASAPCQGDTGEGDEAAVTASSAAEDNEGALGDAVADNPDAEAQAPEEKVKVEPTNDANSDGTTNTTTTVRRDRCWYGVACYKRNPIHQQYFSHPGDNDYSSDPEEHRSICPFGVGCYSFDLNHRRQYKHAGPPAPKPTTSAPATKDDGNDEDQSIPPQKKRQKKRKRKAAQKKKYTETLEDDYDYDNPFLDYRSIILFDGSIYDDYLAKPYSSDDFDFDDSWVTGSLVPN